MNSLTPISANREISSKRIRYWLLLMSANYSLMLGRGVVQIEQGGFHFSRNIENMVFWCYWLRRMTECWTDRLEALSNMRRYIGRYQTSVCSGRFLNSFSAKRFSSRLEDGTRSKKEWICICLLRERDIIVCMILVLLLIARAIMV